MIKRILYILIAIALVSGVAFAETPGFRLNPGTGDILGQGKFQSDAHKIFRMVRYDQDGLAGSTLAADSIVVWDVTNDDGVTITTSTTSYDTTVAGIIVQQAVTQEIEANTAILDRGKRNWTWLQTYGLSQVDLQGPSGTIGDTITAGDAMCISTTAGEAWVFIASTSNPRLQGKAGFFYDASNYGDDDVECFLIGLD